MVEGEMRCPGNFAERDDWPLTTVRSSTTVAPLMVSLGDYPDWRRALRNWLRSKRRAGALGSRTKVLILQAPLNGGASTLMGIRRGTDVLKAMAYGAGSIGRAPDTVGRVKSVLEMLRGEFDLAVALSGCPRLSSITRDLVRPL